MFGHIGLKHVLLAEKSVTFSPKEKISQFAPPTLADGAALHALVARCPPLDPNSRYCNLLQCSHFASTSVLAWGESGALQGAVTGYARPDCPIVLFVWQVAVAPEARGQGLGSKMLAALLARPRRQPFHTLQTTITPSNAASWGLFRRFADEQGAALTALPWLNRERHFAGAQEDETLLTIEPLRT